jgi:large subunit ribosomal protein L18
MAKSTTERRIVSVRRRVKAAAGNRKRLSVFRSSKHIYAQVIDDVEGKTLAAASSLDKDLKRLRTGADKDAAAGSASFCRTRHQGGGQGRVFDRGRYLYHGRVKALADGAREGGLNF